MTCLLCIAVNIPECDGGDFNLSFAYNLTENTKFSWNFHWEDDQKFAKLYKTLKASKFEMEMWETHTFDMGNLDRYDSVAASVQQYFCEY